MAYATRKVFNLSEKNELLVERFKEKKKNKEILLSYLSF